MQLWRNLLKGKINFIPVGTGIKYIVLLHPSEDCLITVKKKFVKCSGFMTMLELTEAQAAIIKNIQQSVCSREYKPPKRWDATQ